MTTGTTVMRPALCLFLALAALLASGCGSRLSKAEGLYRDVLQRHAATVRSSAGASAAEFDGTVRALQQLVSRYPGWEKIAEIQFMIAGMYADRRDYANAINEYTRLYMTFPEKYELCARARFAIGQLCEKQGDWASALKEYKEIIARYPASYPGLQAPLYIAQHYQKNNDRQQCQLAFQSAVHNYLNLIEDDPDSRTALIAQEYLVSAYGWQNEWADAAAALQRIAERYPQSLGAPYALYRAAMIARTRLNRPDRALALLQNVAERYPQSGVGTDALFGVGSLLALQGKVDEATAVFTRCISAHPEDAPLCARAQIAIGRCYENNNRWDEAKAAYTAATERYPGTAESVQAQLLVADHYRRAGEAPAAAAALDSALARGRDLIAKSSDTPAVVATGDLLAEACGQQGRWAEGVEALKAVVQRFPQEETAAPALAKIGTLYYQKLNDLPRAEFYLRQFLKQHPNHRLAVAVQDYLAKMTAAGKEKSTAAKAVP